MIPSDPSTSNFGVQNVKHSPAPGEIVLTPPRRAATSEGCRPLTFSSRKKVDRERSKRLLRACDAVEQARHHGKSIKASLRLAAQRRAKGNYRSRPGKRFPASFSNLRTVYYAWKRDGTAAPIFKLKYKSPAKRLGDRAVQEFVHACLAPGITTIAEAFRRLTSPGVSVWTYYDRLPRKQKKVIRTLHRARQGLAQAERKAARILKP